MTGCLLHVEMVLIKWMGITTKICGWVDTEVMNVKLLSVGILFTRYNYTSSLPAWNFAVW